MTLRLNDTQPLNGGETPNIVDNSAAARGDSVEPRPAVNWIAVLKRYRAPSLKRSWFELFVTIAPLIGLWTGAVWATSISYWLALPICVIAAMFLVRLFLIQHDCSHGAFFKTRASNDLAGRVIGVFTMTPYDVWKDSHLTHHATHGNLKHRGVGDVMTLTVDEFEALPFWGRLAYRLYRHPIVLFGLGPMYIFILHHRLPVGFMTAGWRYWISTMGTNIALAVLLVAGIYLVGLGPFLMTYLVITLLAATIGVWLFYVQHQFEDTIWDTDDEWRLHDAALYGSSHYVLPPVLQWMTANIGIHHVHHLYSRIPFYRLHQVLRDHPELGRVQRLTFIESLKTTRLKLWCARERRLVSWKAAGAA
ncbi:MAG: fatty acid desaturase [Pseudomonadota bacterium]